MHARDQYVCLRICCGAEQMFHHMAKEDSMYVNKCMHTYVEQVGLHSVGGSHVHAHIHTAFS
jgi:hypothetical protein